MYVLACVCMYMLLVVVIVYLLLLLQVVSGSAEDQALWDRLDELEREEEGNGEQEDDESIYKEDVEKEGVAEQKLEVERRRPLLKHDVLERPATESSGVFPDEEMRATGSAPFHITVRHSHSGNDQLSETNKVGVAP